MIDKIKSYQWSCFKGETHWICCFAHILNLIVQVILRPFGSYKKRKNTSSNDSSNLIPGNEDLEDEDVEETDEQIEL